MSQVMAPPQDDAVLLEQLVIHNDWSKLTPGQRLQAYVKLCQHLKLNPYSQPFQFLVLNGKLRLYATKDCTDQLRNLNNISIIGVPEESIVDDLFVVKVRGRNTAGREDAEIGVVPIKGLAAEAKANAIMKAHTKAKRRLTLSLAGLGFTDESEIETIPDARRVNVDMATGEIIGDVEPPNGQPKPPEPPRQTEAARQTDSPEEGDRHITKSELAALQELVSKFGWTEEQFKTRLRVLGYESMKAIHQKRDYPKLVKHFGEWRPDGITPDQLKRLWATAGSNKYSEAEVDAIVQAHGVISTKQLSREQYDAVMSVLSILNEGGGGQ